MSALALASARCALNLARALEHPEPALRRSASAEERCATMSLKVASRDVLNVQKALAQSGAPDARIVECRRVPNSTCSQLRLVCDCKWTGAIMRCVMQTVGAAEFGRCESLRS
jgi:hypothetical protein